MPFRDISNLVEPSERPHMGDNIVANADAGSVGRSVSKADARSRIAQRNGADWDG
jgi:hypothetical protein